MLSSLCIFENKLLEYNVVYLTKPLPVVYIHSIFKCLTSFSYVLHSAFLQLLYKSLLIILSLHCILACYIATKAIAYYVFMSTSATSTDYSLGVLGSLRYIPFPQR